jgi:glycosyltransferase involved in cell wall biosynthesis
MRKPILTIFYQFDPWHPSIGGIQTIIRSLIKYAWSEFEVRLVGISNTPNLRTGVWQEAQLAGKAIRFFPLLTIENDNVRTLVPTTLKYTAALFGRYLASDFMHFHRIEPTLATLHWSGEKTLFVHFDIQEQILSATNKNAILWQYFPAGYFALERLLIGQFSEILSCNTESVKHYQQRYPAIANRVSSIKNPVDNEIFYALTWEKRQEGRRSLARRLRVSEDKRFVLFAGRLHPQKDPILLVRSIAALNEPNIHLLIAGEGELAAQVQAEIYNLGLSEQITMLGCVAQAELAELQRVCSVFVLTSAYEGLPLVALEALACGTPVVTTRCGETPKLLSARSGIVCSDRTPIAVADALRQVLMHSDDYPVEACLQTAEPYSARVIVDAVYSDMLRRWEMKNFLLSSWTSIS